MRLICLDLLLFRTWSRRLRNIGRHCPTDRLQSTPRRYYGTDLYYSSYVIDIIYAAITATLHLYTSVYVCKMFRVFVQKKFTGSGLDSLTPKILFPKSTYWHQLPKYAPALFSNLKFLDLQMSIIFANFYPMAEKSSCASSLLLLIQPGQLTVVENPSQLRYSMASYYNFFSNSNVSGSNDIIYSVPYFDALGLGVSHNILPT